jgi:hypothetical protein
MYSIRPNGGKIILLRITQDPEGDDITTTHNIFNGFPRNQYRPVFLHYGRRIPLIRSLPKHLWNFARADWESFGRYMVHMRDSQKQWLLQWFLVVIEISTSMWWALQKIQFWSWKRISCACPWEVEWTKKIDMGRHCRKKPTSHTSAAKPGTYWRN